MPRIRIVFEEVTSSGKGIDAAGMVNGGIDGVGSNDIDVQFL